MEEAETPTGRCPYCQNMIVPEVEFLQKVQGGDYVFVTNVVRCPECETILGANSTSEEVENIDATG